MPPQDPKSVKQFWRAIIGALIVQVIITVASAYTGHVRLSEASKFQNEQIQEIKSEIKEIRRDIYQVRGSESNHQ